MTCRGLHVDSLSLRFCGFNRDDEEDDYVVVNKTSSGMTALPTIIFYNRTYVIYSHRFDEDDCK